MQCVNCNTIIQNLDDVPQHACFVGRNVYLNNENNLFVENIENKASKEETKEPALWDRSAILALLSLYDANKNLIHDRKKTKIWDAISLGLQENFGIHMSTDQVRWKMNSLVRKYKECIDNNNKSGRSPMSFQYFDQIHEILYDENNASTNYTVSSKVLSDSNSITSKKSGESSKTVLECNMNPALNNRSNGKRQLTRGTGSNIAKKKINVRRTMATIYGNEN